MVLRGGTSVLGVVAWRQVCSRHATTRTNVRGTDGALEASGDTLCCCFADERGSGCAAISAEDRRADQWRAVSAFRLHIEEPSWATSAALGYAADKDIVIELRFAERKLDRLPTSRASWWRRRPISIFALGGLAAVAAQKATASGPPPLVPVVFAIVTDPVALKLVASMDRPGANVTGLTSLDPQQAGAQFALPSKKCFRKRSASPS